jgi:hypothetical protein
MYVSVFRIMAHTLTSGHNDQLTEDELNGNYEYFIDFIKQKFTGDRLNFLLGMYDENNLGTQTCLAPASGKPNFHYAFSGGYLLHILNVEKASRGVEKVFQAMGGIIDYTDEERIFAALHHDLGKLGDNQFGGYYLPQTDQWRRDKLNEVFTINKDAPPWDVTDRALYLLQHYGVRVTWKETLAIKMSDGVFSEKNVPYWKSHDDLKTNLCNVIHWADWMSCRAEKCQWGGVNFG